MSVEKNANWRVLVLGLCLCVLACQPQAQGETAPEDAETSVVDPPPSPPTDEPTDPSVEPQDTTPPSVASLTPLDRAEGVAPDTVLRVVFSEPLDAAFAGAIAGAALVSPAHPVVVTLNDAATTLSIAPTTPWIEGVKYNVSVSGALVDAAGLALGVDQVFSFRVASQPGLVVENGLADVSGLRFVSNTNVASGGYYIGIAAWQERDLREEDPRVLRWSGWDGQSNGSVSAPAAWSPPETLSGACTLVDLAAHKLSPGRFLLVATCQDAVRAWTIVFNPNGSWSVSATVLAEGLPQSPEVALDVMDAAVVIVWRTGATLRYVYVDDGVIGESTDVMTSLDEHATSAVVKLQSDRALVTYRRMTMAGLTVEARHVARSLTGAVSAATQLDAVYTGEGAQIGLRGATRFATAWCGNGLTHATLEGLAADAPVLVGGVTSTGASCERRPAVVADSADALFAWRNGIGVDVLRLRANDTEETETIAGGGDYPDSNMIGVAMSAQHFLVHWRAVDGGSYRGFVATAARSAELSNTVPAFTRLGVTAQSEETHADAEIVAFDAVTSGPGDTLAIALRRSSGLSRTSNVLARASWLNGTWLQPVVSGTLEAEPIHSSGQPQRFDVGAAAMSYIGAHPITIIAQAGRILDTRGIGALVATSIGAPAIVDLASSDAQVAAVFRRGTGNDEDVFVTVHEDGTWSDARAFGVTRERRGSNPRLATADGVTIAALGELPDDTQLFEQNRLVTVTRTGGAWITHDIATTARALEVGAAGGGAFAAWLRRDPGDDTSFLEAQTFNGEAWSSTVNLRSFPPGAKTHVLSASHDGAAALVLVVLDSGADDGIWVFDFVGTFAPAQHLRAATVYDVEEPARLAAGPVGLVVSWVEPDVADLDSDLVTDEPVAYASVRSASGWQTATSLGQLDPLGLSVAGDGATIATWREADTGGELGLATFDGSAWHTRTAVVGEESWNDWRGGGFRDRGFGLLLGDDGQLSLRARMRDGTGDDATTAIEGSFEADQLWLASCDPSALIVLGRSLPQLRRFDPDGLLAPAPLPSSGSILEQARFVSRGRRFAAAIESRSSMNDKRVLRLSPSF